MFDLQSGDTSVSSAAANFGEVGGPGLVKSTYTTSTWCPLGPLAASAVKGANGVSGRRVRRWKPKHGRHNKWAGRYCSRGPRNPRSRRGCGC
ncbi:hypothetical protein WN55_11417 [Dufourea novaeangliae]|uniref:Uncharacterized protein n=1 Tax=Dufourea novaeangliae TaxID=178035 RepID=A0A154PC01_DUFNO|nr:hypothetical protein WN55_11417 [Dufourea novaeangliae]